MKLLNSVVVSAMVSETKVFTCYEFPEWMRLFWVMWALLPTVVCRLFRGIVTALKSIETDFITGLGWFLAPLLPVAYAVG